MKKIQIVLVIAVLSLIGAVVYTFDKSPRAEGSNGHSTALLQTTMNLQATAAGITVNMTNVKYSSTKTEVTFFVVNPAVSPSLTGPIVGPIKDADITTSGIAPAVLDKGARILEQSSLRKGANEETRQISLNPVADTTKGVNVTINALCVVQTQDAPCLVTRGPWSFDFTPGATAKDPIAKHVTVGATIQTGQGLILVKEAAQSSSELLLSYSIPAEGDDIMTIGPGIQELILPTGNVVEASINRTLPDGTHVASFPPLPPGVKSFRVRAKGFLREDNFITSQTTFTLAANSIGTDVNSVGSSQVSVGQEGNLAGARIRIDSVEVGNKQVKVTVLNLSPNEKLIGGLKGSVSLVDDKGKSHSIRARNLSFPEGLGGDTHIGPVTLVFDGFTQSDLGTMTLRSGSASLVSGPWDTVLALP